MRHSASMRYKSRNLQMLVGYTDNDQDQFKI